MKGDRLLTAPEAAEYVGLSVAAFWRSVANGRFPQPFYPAPRAPRWQPAELREALEATRALPREQMARRRSAKLQGAT
jgi:predicted DNA-binding transcriptional regulator AlpA